MKKLIASTLAVTMLATPLVGSTCFADEIRETDNQCIAFVNITENNTIGTNTTSWLSDLKNTVVNHAIRATFSAFFSVKVLQRRMPKESIGTTAGAAVVASSAVLAAAEAAGAGAVAGAAAVAAGAAVAGAAVAGAGAKAVAAGAGVVAGAGTATASASAANIVTLGTTAAIAGAAATILS